MSTSDPKTLNIRPFKEADRSDLITLWFECGLIRPWNDPDRDIDLAMRDTHSTILVGTIDDTPRASAMVGEDGHRGWVYYLAVAKVAQRQGLGEAMMDATTGWLNRRGIPKIQLMVRDDNTHANAFYEQLGYVRQEVAVYGKWLKDDS